MELKLSFSDDNPPLSVIAASKVAGITIHLDSTLESASAPTSSGSEFENAAVYLDGYLLQRTLLVGHNLTIADLAIWSGLAGSGQRWESLRKSRKYQNLVRWFNSSELVNLLLVEFDYLITKKKLEEGEEFVDVLNPYTKKETAAQGDSNMRNLKRGEILQLERKGYFRCDVSFVILPESV